MKLAVFALTFFGFAAASLAQALPRHWAELRALPPNVASFVYMNSVPEKESSVTLQIHAIEGNVQTLREQIKQDKLPKKFGTMKLLSQEKFGRCTRLSLEHSNKKLFFERQTWCFGDKAWVVIERGPWRIGDSFVSELLKKNGWGAK